ncbi:MAG: hypothetical protein KIT84_10995 [Labilithrix sp.]|nr:hypothetical protein [Labilithrix sp.]MCW5811534.1 hypothetical protein [Labilithrix sp.]
MMQDTPTVDLAKEFRLLLAAVKATASDLGPELDEMLVDGARKPLEPAEAERLLVRVVETIRRSADERGDARTAEAARANVNDLLALATSARDRVRSLVSARPVRMEKTQTCFLLKVHNSIERGPVVPTPVFHEKEVPMNGGFIRTSDIKLWESNERLEIHVAQFRAKNSRPPSPEELFQIMTGKMLLEGVGAEDEFAILDLARSIAANGVRKPPIVDVDGALLDGNRRVSACMLILSDTSGEFTSEDKKRAEFIFVWQLTPHATADDRQRVIVSLNFESDQKKDWPEYIKARKVYEEWNAMLAVETPKPGPKQQAAMKRTLSKKYALGPDTAVVNRYLKMMKWAEEFEEHHINTRKHDVFTVKHRATKYFQYFDEIAKGETTGGVASALSQSDTLRQTVFDMLFDNKFDNWTKIRPIKHIATSEEARALLAKAHVEPDIEQAQELLDLAITAANAKRAEQRSVGADQRIENFTKWLEEVPPITLYEVVTLDNVKRLSRAMGFVEGILQKRLAAAGPDDVD